MGAVLDLINKLRSEAPIPKQEAAILDIVEENKNLIVDLNTGQLMEGVDANAKYLRDYSNPQYALFKLSLNARGVTDLKLRGNFHRGFYLTADKWPVLFNSTDRKRDQLTEQYGRRHFRTYGEK